MEKGDFRVQSQKTNQSSLKNVCVCVGGRHLELPCKVPPPFHLYFSTKHFTPP